MIFVFRCKVRKPNGEITDGCGYARSLEADASAAGESRLPCPECKTGFLRQVERPTAYELAAGRAHRHGQSYTPHGAQSGRLAVEAGKSTQAGSPADDDARLEVLRRAHARVRALMVHFGLQPRRGANAMLGIASVEAGATDAKDADGVIRETIALLQSLLPASPIAESRRNGEPGDTVRETIRAELVERQAADAALAVNHRRAYKALETCAALLGLPIDAVLSRDVPQELRLQFEAHDHVRVMSAKLLAERDEARRRLWQLASMLDAHPQTAVWKRAMSALQWLQLMPDFDTRAAGDPPRVGDAVTIGMPTATYDVRASSAARVQTPLERLVNDLALGPVPAGSWSERMTRGLDSARARSVRTERPAQAGAQRMKQHLAPVLAAWVACVICYAAGYIAGHHDAQLARPAVHLRSGGNQ